ncbi:taurine catabolism dioxygenase family protein [Lophiostoma macrostomum CBS 122681]|uniref:Taurine catabolism dioxygenase family protein n=1 Tax=Lophiostoma macrostomum CBS 122681 TaxID=1314788 RepID=A0A6A6STV7_9PLEO|nr:taurine catabolism dioxygenase family protein [Lophiostoma macrostomum CBS 122681]
MAAAAVLAPYELHTSAPGYLYNEPEWKALNSAHPSGTDFGALPAGWPSKFTGPKLWSGDELQTRPGDYIHVLSQSEIEEIDAALQFWKNLAKPVGDITRDHFPLSNLGPQLRILANNIYNGVGIQILRGFPIKQYSKKDQVLVFLGINSWIADRRLDQGAKRGVTHIKSVTHIDPSKRGKIYVSAQDTQAQTFHNDAGSDVVGLMAVSLSGHGGLSSVASAARVYNHLAEHRPDILRIMAETKFRWKGRGIPKEGVRLIHHKRGQLYLNFSTRPFHGYGEVPEHDSEYQPLTFEEREAFGGWQWTAHKLSLQIALREGDFEWVNNLQVQHGRTEFTEEQSNPRHLLRVWLRDTELSPELPADIANKFDAMFDEEPENYPIDELEEDRLRQATGIYTGNCKDEQASDRLDAGGIRAGDEK